MPEVDKPYLEKLKIFEPMVAGCRGRVRWAATNAVHHLDSAVKLIEVDPLMAAFRAICAEEEAATSLISSLRQASYPGAKSIRFRDHKDKHAVIVLIKSVMNWYEGFKVSMPDSLGRMALSRTTIPGREAFLIAVEVVGSTSALSPLPPLNIRVTGPDKTGWLKILEDQLSELFDGKRFNEVKGEIDKRANLRNQILYATETGVPSAGKSVDEFVENQARIVSVLLYAIGLIDPWRTPRYEQSPIVVASISVLLKIMDRLKHQESMADL